MSRWRLAGRGLLAMALLALVVGAYRSFERVPVEKVDEMVGAARFNEFLAAERFLAGRGLAARSVRNLRELPEPGALLVLAAAGHGLDALSRARALTWAAEGGHLVHVGEVDPERLPDEHDPGSSDDEDDARLDSVPAATADGLRVEVVSHLPLIDVPADAEPLLTVGAEVHAATRRHGAGRVTTASTLAFLHNQRIGLADHAAFLARVAALSPAESAVIVFRDERPSLIALILDTAWPVSVSAVVLLTLWVWSASRRFGPLLPARPSGRRRLAEHIEASGRFLWRAGQHEALYRDAKASVLRTLEFRHPGWVGSAALYDRLAQGSGLDRGRVRAALERSGPAGTLEFTEAMADLERIRRSL